MIKGIVIGLFALMMVGLISQTHVVRAFEGFPNAPTRPEACETVREYQKTMTPEEIWEIISLWPQRYAKEVFICILRKD